MSDYTRTLSRINVDDPKALALLMAIQKTHVNGAGIVWCISSNETRSLTRTALQKAFSQSLLRELLTCDVMRSELPELAIDTDCQVPFAQTLSSYELEGGLIQLLMVGGAYHNWDGREDTARKVACEFVELIGEGDRQQLIAFRVEEALTDWFYGVAWDSIFVACHLGTEKWWFICATDTD